MNLPYTALADCYDRLNAHIDYQGWASSLAAKMKANGVPDGALVLDLACGTGNIALPLAAMGYDMIGVDISSDMLNTARQKEGADRILWLSSVSLVIFFFLIFDRVGFLTLVASLIGVTSLIFNAKGNPIGQILMILFSILYGIISYSFAYYGEMVTYLGMTAPMAAVALVAWLRNPYKGNRAEVAVAHMKGKDWTVMSAVTVAVTVAIYFILQYFHTANLIPSTFSVTTSFAAWLTYKRSPWFAVAYAANDVVLIVLWVLASMTDRSYVSVTVCFAVFLINDLYGFINWRKMRTRQEQNIAGRG